VLIVDDQPVNIQSMSKLLTGDYRILIATSGARALDIAAGENPPDLILLDILMPEMDGYEVCLRLKANEQTRSIPVIFVTAMDATEDEEKGLSLGAVDYISKPFQPSIVRARVRNQTERKRAEDALRQAYKKLSLLSGITRHDINNQLTILMGYLSMLEEQQPDPTFHQYFETINTAANRIAAMIRFTKEYEEIGVHAPSWQDFRTLVDTAAKQAPLGKVMVKNDLPSGVEVFADPLILKVFYNLMDNAVRYGGKITTIRFSVLERDGEEVVVCEDDGNGVPAEEKKKIFERGFGKNTGLGLALAREILDITGITIIETGEPGKGARFEIVVPKGTWRVNRELERAGR
jgi:CheY-like chemotaxis protein